MLFDLQGKRRRVVQVVYLGLAILMGGGLVLFGIGGDVSGGLFDAFSDRNGGGGSGNAAIEERIDRNEERVAKNPDATSARKQLVRDYYQLATTRIGQGEVSFPEESQDDLRSAAANWSAYIKALGRTKKEPDASLATVALQIFDPTALNRPKDAQEAARIVAEQRNNSNAYIGLVQYATLAGDTRTADLAGQKAIDLAPKADRKDVEALVDQAKTPPTQGDAPPSGG